jgi:queuosine precursor transporter
VMVTNYLLKTGWEVLMTPVTYKVVAFLKRKEHEDYYDIGTDFTPFSLKT